MKHFTIFGFEVCLMHMVWVWHRIAWYGMILFMTFKCIYIPQRLCYICDAEICLWVCLHVCVSYSKTNIFFKFLWVSTCFATCYWRLTSDNNWFYIMLKLSYDLTFFFCLFHFLLLQKSGVRFLLNFTISINIRVSALSLFIYFAKEKWIDRTGSDHWK